jgi:hypothetical protein
VDGDEVVVFLDAWYAKWKDICSAARVYISCRTVWPGPADSGVRQRAEQEQAAGPETAKWKQTGFTLPVLVYCACGEPIFLSVECTCGSFLEMWVCGHCAGGA